MTYNSVNQNTRNQRLSRTLATMVSVFTLSALPTVVTLLAIFSPEIDQTRPQSLNMTAAVANTTAQMMAAIIFLCSSLWNFFIYNGRNKDFRDAYANLKKKLWQNMHNCWVDDSEL